MKNVRRVALIPSLLAMPLGTALAATPCAPVETEPALVVVAWLVSLTFLVAVLVGVSSRLEEATAATRGEGVEERPRRAA